LKGLFAAGALSLVVGVGSQLVPRRESTPLAPVGERIKALSPDALRMARVAAVAKDGFSDEVFTKAVGSRASTLDLQALRKELVDAHLMHDGKIANEAAADAALFEGMKARDQKKLTRNVNAAMSV
jgi:hypothetical protein